MKTIEKFQLNLAVPPKWMRPYHLLIFAFVFIFFLGAILRFSNYFFY